MTEYRATITPEFAEQLRREQTQAGIIVNLADESITDLANSVVVRDWHQGDLTDEDTVLYAEAHGKSLADLLSFVRKIARYSTMTDIATETRDVGIEDVEDVLTEARATAVDDMDSLIREARNLI